jgi:hypothetical protein
VIISVDEPIISKDTIVCQIHSIKRRKNYVQQKLEREERTVGTVADGACS